MYVCVNLLAGHVADGSRKRCISSSYVIAKAKKERRRKLEEGSLFAAVEYEVEHTYCSAVRFWGVPAKFEFIIDFSVTTTTKLNQVLFFIYVEI